MRIISGIQPTGSKHLGNLIGAIQQYVAYQDQGESFTFVADLHALTVMPDPATLREDTRSTVALLFAAGLDQDRSTLFVQSHVAAAHTEMAWLLQCVASYGELGRMTQFKDKTDGKTAYSAGLFTYPVLQAADILLYDVDVVPVGADQKQHIELARNIAQRVNARYATEADPIFVVPEPVIPAQGGRVMDLQDPTKKMSTSSDSPKGRIMLLEEPEAIVKKFRSAVTDSENVVRPGADKPGITNLLEIMSIVTGRRVDDLVREFGDSGYGTFKTAVGESVAEHLRPLRERYTELMADPGELDRLLTIGADRVRGFAEAKVARVRDAMGTLPAVR